MQGQIRDLAQCEKCDTPCRAVDRRRYVQRVLGDAGDLAPAGSSGACESFVANGITCEREDGVTFSAAVTGVSTESRQVEIWTTAALNIGEAITIYPSVGQGYDGVGFHDLGLVRMNVEVLRSRDRNELKTYVAVVKRSAPDLDYLSWYAADWSDRSSSSSLV
ncbi:hypothetical protein BHK69_01005 [Bosea vaviloviae]|uniref:Uncharacterized protein n=2 Tax=Bosea vaviloviae TaxID=1526658 RepID=A0A1D7TVV6_9HYPH|nr:hypothetical protein BHK69_01005 [Bosea vaviloviae]